MSLVAIVGRPNVGKSTLFNRILGRRSAIVDNLPGVTRDRHYALAEWAGKLFTVVDTGGYVPDSVDMMEVAIREQAALAIEEADLVLFVVDAKEGVHPTDRDLADILRRGGKKVRLVVNKVDSPAGAPAAAEFYALGLGDPLIVAALGGSGTGDMLDAVTAGLPGLASAPTDPRLKIAVLGRPNVGKSSFVNALLQQDRHIVTSVPGTTRDPIDAVLRFHGEEILLIDTAGLRRKSKVQESVEFYSAVRTLKSIERCDVAVVLIDVKPGLEHQDLRILEMCLQRRRPVVLTVNKWDLIEKDSATASHFEHALRERLRKLDFLPIVFISAMTRQRVTKVIEIVRTVDAEQQRRIPTNALNEALGQDIALNPPRSRSGKEVKIKYVTQVDVKPPVFAFFCNEPDLVDDQYRRYLENRIRERYGFTGVPLVLAFKQK
jgi:GTPase